MRVAFLLSLLWLGAGCLRRPVTSTAAVLDYVRSLEEEDSGLYRNAIDSGGFQYSGPAHAGAAGKLEFTAADESKDLPRLFKATSLRFSSLTVEQRSQFEIEVGFEAMLFMYDDAKANTGAFNLQGRWRFGLTHQADGVVITRVDELPSKQRSGATFAFVKWLHSGRFGTRDAAAAICRPIKGACSAEELIDGRTGAAIGTRVRWTDKTSTKVSFLDASGKRVANFSGL